MLDMLKFSITADAKTARAMAQVKGELSGIKGVLASTGDYARRAGKALRNIGVGLSAGITAPLTALSFYAGNAATSLLELQNQAALSGVDPTTLKVLALASDEFGISQEKLADILKDTNDKMGDFLSTGQGPLADFFENIAPKVGLTKDAFVGLSSSDALRKYVGALEEAGVSMSEMTFYLEALASDATSLLPVFMDGGRAIDDMGAAAARLGLKIDNDLLTSVRETERDFRVAKEVLGIQFKQAVVSLLPEISKLASSFKPVVDGISDAAGWFSGLDPEVRKNVVVFGGLAAAAGPVLLVLGQMTTGIVDLMGLMPGLARAALQLAPAMWAAAGPWAIIAALAAGAGAYFLVFRTEAEKIPTPLEQAKAAQDALNTALGTFATQAAPSAGTAAINAANDFYEKAKAAREAAASNIAMLQSELALQQGINDGLKFGNFFGADEERIILEDMGVAKQELAEAERLLGVAQNQRASTTRRVMSADREMVEVQKALSNEVKVTVDGVDWLDKILGKVGSSGVGNVENLKDAIGKTKEKTDHLGQSFGQTMSSIIRGASTAGEALSRLLDQMADRALTSLFSSLWGNTGLGGFFGGLFANADGNAFSGGRVVPFATGGVVTGPTLFPMAGRNTGLMGEAGPEAIMPLTRVGGKLGVRAEGGGGASGALDISIGFDDSAGSFVATVRDETGREIAQAIEAYDRHQAPATARRALSKPRMR